MRMCWATSRREESSVGYEQQMECSWKKRWWRGSRTDKGWREIPNSPTAETQHRGNTLRPDGQRLFKCNCVFRLFVLGETSHERDLLSHSQTLTSTTSWRADKLSRATATRTDLMDNSIRIELSTMLRGHQPYSSGPLSVSQISGLHFIRPELIVHQLTRTWLKGPITIVGKSEHVHSGLYSLFFTKHLLHQQRAGEALLLEDNIISAMQGKDQHYHQLQGLCTFRSPHNTTQHKCWQC